MRSIFFKIFVWLWLAMALVVLAHSLSTMIVFDETPRRRMGGEFTMYGLAAAERYEREGEDGANNYISLLESTTRFHAYLFDGQGNQVAGREAPPRVAEIARSLVGKGDEDFIQTARTDYAARKINAPGGGLLVKIVLPIQL